MKGTTSNTKKHPFFPSPAKPGSSPAVKVEVKKSGISVENEMNAIFTSYEERGWEWFSCGLGWDATAINYDKTDKKKVLGYGKKLLTFGAGRDWKVKANRQKDLSETGFGLVCGEENGIVVIDIDNPELPHNRTLMEYCDEVANCVAQTKKGKHYVFKYCDALAKTHNFGKLEFDVKSNGGFILVEPSRYTTHEGRTIRYKWVLFPEDDEELAEVPQKVIDFIHECLKPKELPKKDKAKKDKETDKINKAVEKMEIKTDGNIIREALMAVSEDRADNYEDWIHALFALKNADQPYEVFEEFSLRSPKAGDGSPYYMWNAVKKSDCDAKITPKTIFWWLKNDNPEKFLELCAMKSEYEQMKAEFEANTCLVGATLWTIYPDGTRTQCSVADARIKYMNKMVKVWDEEKEVNKNAPFFEIWLRDPDRRDYDRIGFYPNRSKCPPRVYNLFTGFKVEEYTAEVPTEKEELERLIRPILNHMTLLTNGEDESGYFLKWLANIVKDPDNKSDIGILFRAVGKFLAEGGGEGKNIFFEWFGYKILGERYYLGIADNANLYDAFNSMFEGVLLCFIDEANGKDNHTQSDKLKAKITSRKTLINRKNMPQYVVSDYCRYAFASNNFNPLRVGAGDRRISAFDVSSEKRNDIGYFTELSKAMADERVAVAFYKYLMTYVEIYPSPVYYQRHRPITKAYISLRQANAPLITKWIVDKLRKGKLLDGYVSKLFASFERWCMDTKERVDGEKTMTLTSFGRLLNDNTNLMRLDEDSDGEVVRMGDKTTDYKGGKFFRWNYKSLIEHLERLHLLSVGELELKEDGTPVCMIDAQPQPDKRPVEEEE